MTRTGTIGAALLAGLAAAGCEQPFSPKEFVGDQCVVQCIVPTSNGTGRSFQSLLLARVYDVPGLDPRVNTEDPAVLGALVFLTVDGAYDTLFERTRLRTDSLRYGSSQPYYGGSVPAPGPQSRVQLDITLPNGRLITAQTTTPRERASRSSVEFPQGLTSRPPTDKIITEWTVSWEEQRAPEEGHLFFPVLRIQYTRDDDTTESAHSIEVPATYSRSTGVSVYPAASTRTWVTFTFEALDHVMASISGDDPVKRRYSAHEAVLQLIEYDSPLSRYYASTRGALDQFSIRVSQPTYTNVSGATGILGSYYVNTWRYELNMFYVAGFGYNFR